MNESSITLHETFCNMLKEHTDAFRRVKDAVLKSHPDPVKARFKARPLLLEMRTNLFDEYLGITESTFDTTPVLFGLKSQFTKMMDERFDSADEWWSAANGWTEVRVSYCVEDIAVPLGPTKKSRPSEWSPQDVLRLIAIQMAYDSVAFEYMPGMDAAELQRTSHKGEPIDDVCVMRVAIGTSPTDYWKESLHQGLQPVSPQEQTASFPSSFDGTKSFTKWLVKVTAGIGELKITTSDRSLHTTLKQGWGDIKFNKCKTHRHMYRLVEALISRFTETGKGYQVYIGDKIKNEAKINDVKRKHKNENCPNNVREIINHVERAPIGKATC